MVLEAVPVSLVMILVGLDSLSPPSDWGSLRTGTFSPPLVSSCISKDKTARLTILHGGLDAEVGNTSGGMTAELDEQTDRQSGTG